MFKGLKATNEWQDDGVDIYIAPSSTIPYRPSTVYLYRRCPYPYPLAAEQVGLYAPQNSHPS